MDFQSKTRQPLRAGSPCCAGTVEASPTRLHGVALRINLLAGGNVRVPSGKRDGAAQLDPVPVTSSLLQQMAVLERRPASGTHGGEMRKENPCPTTTENRTPIRRSFNPQPKTFRRAGPGVTPPLGPLPKQPTRGSNRTADALWTCGALALGRPPSYSARHFLVERSFMNEAMFAQRSRKLATQRLIAPLRPLSRRRRPSLHLYARHRCASSGSYPYADTGYSSRCDADLLLVACSPETSVANKTERSRGASGAPSVRAAQPGRRGAALNPRVATTERMARGAQPLEGMEIAGAMACRADKALSRLRV
jgi:hypothetical protein